MTITNTSNKITYTGSGTTGPFTYNFKIFEDTDLEVTKHTIADGTSVTLALTTDYTVTGAGNDAGGTITLTASLSSSYKLIIRRVLPITQEIDYIANDPFPAATHEEALDRSTMINQQQQEQLDRAVLVPVGTTTDPEELLAEIEANAATAEAAADTATAAVGSLVYYWGATVGGTADAITLTPSPAILLYSAGMRFAFLATGTNTGATTVNISGLGAKSVKTLLGATLAAGDITSGNVYSMTYDGTNFRIHESPKVLPVANGGTGQTTALPTYMNFVDRGDPAAVDYNETGSKAVFNTDGNWHDLDLSAIVPAGAYAILIQLSVTHTSASQNFSLRKKGNSNAINIATIRTQVASVAIVQQVTVTCDANRVIQYLGANSAFAGVALVVVGWWI